MANEAAWKKNGMMNYTRSKWTEYYGGKKYREGYEQIDWSDGAKAPDPGSEDAQKQGCTCPVLDNEYGRGYFGQEGVFVITEGCPLHATGGPAGEDAQDLDSEVVDED